MNELSEREASELYWTPTIDPTWAFDRWWNRLWNETGVSVPYGTWNRAPFGDGRQFRTEVVDRAEAFDIVVDLPGVPKDQIEVTVRGNRLRVAAHQSTPATAPGTDAPTARTIDTIYERSFELPHPIPTGSITAHSENGVLTVTIPKPKPLPEEKVPIG
ncbi:MAG TPA: Hsp20/alpha crystallin family protein [Thermoplasmata archaeon]|nr:Hsp20/alpha crystallin family protein [Thermoplasmata archaeon]